VSGVNTMNKLSLAKINFYNVLFTAFLFTISIGIVEVYSSYAHFEKQVQRMQDRYISTKKKRSKEQVNKLVKQIQENIHTRYTILEKALEQNVEELSSLYNSIKSKNQNLNNKEILKYFIKEVDNIKLPNSSVYYYIFDQDTNFLYHGNQKKLAGQNIRKNIKQEEILSFIEKSLTSGYATGLYEWQNPKTKKIEKKFAYIKKIPNTDIYLATGFYVNDIEKDIKNDIIKTINETRFGLDKKGYFWIHSLSGVMIINPMQPQFNEKSVFDYKTLKNRYPFREMNKIALENNSGFIDYFWKYPLSEGKEEKKISYIKNLDYFGWVVGSGFYFRKQLEIVKSEEKYLQEELEESLFRLFVILILIFGSSVLVAYYISRKITQITQERKLHLNMLEQYKIVLDESSIVSKTDKNGFITYVNKQFEKACGYKTKELIGKSHSILRHQSMPKETFSTMWNNISMGKIWSGIIKNKKKDGTSYYIRMIIIPIKDADNNVLEYISASTEITELMTKNNLLEKFTLTDGLTGLGSRVKLMNDLFKTKYNILAIVDILKFTEVNDMYGQKVGDKIIKEVAQEIFEFSKNNHTKVYRLHADVFAILCVDSKSTEFILQINHLVNYLKNYHFDKNEVNATFDFVCGISQGNEKVLACADMALKEAKRKHLPVSIYNKDNSLLDEYKNNAKWMKVVVKALEEDRIVPYFQPIYSYKNKNINKYESLMRLIDENGNIITPMNFLSVIKQTSIYPKITQTMIRKTVDKFRYTPKDSFSINITLEDLLNKETMQYFYTTISSADIFNRLIIEIVESDELINFEKVGEILSEFKARGTKIAIDDFGTGYSNYNYLLKLDVDYIKIDGSIIKNIADKKTKELITTIVAFAKKSDIQTIAEFVSDSTIDANVEALEIDFAQGYFRGKPYPHI